jgi:GWxTD domain-containing protein
MLLSAQQPYQETFSPRYSKDKSQRLNPILIRPYPISTEGGNYKLYFLVEIMYDVMQFVRQEGKYTANFQIELNLTHTNSNRLYSKLWQTEFTLDNFSETNSRHQYLLTTESVIVPAGDFRTVVTYQDFRAKRKISYRLNINLPPSRDIYASSPLFISTAEPERADTSLFPARPLALFSHLPFNTPLNVFLYSHSSEDSTLNIQMQIIKEKDREQIFQLDTVVVLKDGVAKTIIDPPFLRWSEGDYIMNINYHNEAGEFKHDLPFEIIWFRKPRSLRSVDYAIKATQIILSEEEYSNMHSGNKDEQRQNLYAYWEEKDPTPETAFNEKMAVFYSRVDSADLKWGGKGRTYGWKTDLGRIYVIYGPPHQIEDRSLIPVNPYLKWIYHMPDQKKVFIFEATDGRKKYNLIREIKEQRANETN